MKRPLLIVFLEHLQYCYLLFFTWIKELIKRRCCFYEKSANFPSDDKVDKVCEKIILSRDWRAAANVRSALLS